MKTPEELEADRLRHEAAVERGRRGAEAARLRRLQNGNAAGTAAVQAPVPPPEPTSLPAKVFMSHGKRVDAPPPAEPPKTRILQSYSLPVRSARPS